MKVARAVDGEEEFVSFKLLFYRYNMNDRDLRKKKHSQTSLKSTAEKHLYLSNVKVGPGCKPKQPPNISNHYRLEGIRKAQIHPSNSDHDTFEPHTRMPRSSNGKGSEDIQKTKKLKDIHHISKPNKIKDKMQNRENRELRSNIDLNASRVEKLAKTETYLDDPLTLFCKERFNKRGKKGGKTQEGFSKGNSGLACTSVLMQIASQKSHKKTFAEQLAEFEVLAGDKMTKEDAETQRYLFEKEQMYSRIQNYNCYLVKNHPEIPWFKRAIVINWMSIICAGFGCKRETFALGVNYLDRYLTLTQNVPLSRLQLIAAAAMSISNKSQGARFTIRNLVEESEGFGVTEVAEMEEEILWKLEWKLHPPTSNMWANRIALQWDMYLDHQEHLVAIMQENLGCVKFKTMDIEGYQNFRSLMQYVDFSLMEVHTLQYHCRELAASFIYIILNLKLRLYSEEEIINDFPRKSGYLLASTEFNGFYCQFLKHSFGFSLQDLLPTVQYCATFLLLPLDFGLPPAVQGIEEQDDLDYSEFCSFQTCNQNYLPCLMNRNRQYD